MATQVSDKKVLKVTIDEAGFTNARTCYKRDYRLVDSILAIEKAKGIPAESFEKALKVVDIMRGLDDNAQRALKALLTVDKEADPMNCLALAHETIGIIRVFAQTGSTYTPRMELGFGSDPSHIIARKILGTDTSAAKVRSAFRSIG